MSAVYTGIKKPESFSHSGFSLKVARQLPLNTPKNPNRKTHLRSVIFWNSAEISLVFCQCKRSLQSRWYYSGFWSRGTWPSAESPDRGVRRNAHYTCTVKGREKSRMRTTYQNTRLVWDSGFFAHALFVPKTPNVMGFSGSVNGTTKNPGFLDFGFCQCKWAYRWFETLHICEWIRRQGYCHIYAQFVSKFDIKANIITHTEPAIQQSIISPSGR